MRSFSAADTGARPTEVPRALLSRSEFRFVSRLIRNPIGVCIAAKLAPEGTKMGRVGEDPLGFPVSMQLLGSPGWFPLRAVAPASLSRVCALETRVNGA